MDVKQTSVDTGEIDRVVAEVSDRGFGILSGTFTEQELTELELELADAQRRVVVGALDARHGTVILDDPDATIDGQPFAHYVTFATDVSPLAAEAVGRPALVEVARRYLGPDAWLLDDGIFGVVYQDARPGPGSAYSRIGWHTDHQSGPHLAMWPGLAFTIHFDATSPANGFLRVLPGSHHGGTEGIPLGFERVPGEFAVYADRGDVLFHHSDLWHAAARATDDGAAAIRRHLRGSWHGGARLDAGHGTDDFIKNARR